jgi:tetratricopeptide repeat protein 30
MAAILYKEGNFEGAMEKFNEAKNGLGYQSDIAYNIALCNYKLKNYGEAAQHINDIIDRGVRSHPELSVGSASLGVEVRSVGNSQTLKETALVEAFNLKAAIAYQLQNFPDAREALADMPPRSDAELDPVTLMNQALMNMDTMADDGFEKMNFLLQQPAFPPETFGNLLLLYCKYQYYDVAADVLARNLHLHDLCLSKELYDYLEATILTQSSPEEAYRKFDQLAHKHTTTLRQVTKEVNDARNSFDNERTKAALKQYDDALERYVPVLMAQAKIYWDIENYSMVERIFKQSAEFCSEHTTWKLNVAHVFFMQESKYTDAIRFYTPAIQKKVAANSSLLDVTAIVLANLCVSHIMTNQNDEAEALMLQIEKEEDRQSLEDPEKQSYHLCIVNLVIGTLYCAKGNFEFGISRIIKSLEPYHKKLGVDTWYYAKRCFLALFEALAKHMLVATDDFFESIMAFLDEAEQHGRNIITVVSSQDTTVDPQVHNVAYEARRLKRMLLMLRD